MNTSIPTTHTSDPAGALAPASDPTLAALLESLPGATPSAAGPAADTFADLLAGTPAPVAPVATGTGQPADAAAPAGQGSSPVLLTTPGVMLCRLAGAGLRPGLLKAAAHSPVLATAQPDGTMPADDAAVTPVATAPTREEIEQALALLAPLWNILAPALNSVSLPPTDTAPAALTVSLQGAGQPPRTATLDLPATAETLASALDQLFSAPASADGTSTAFAGGTVAATALPDQPAAPAPTPTAQSVPVLADSPPDDVANSNPAAAPVANPLPTPASTPAPAGSDDDDPAEPVTARPATGLEIRLPGGATLSLSAQTSEHSGQGQADSGSRDNRQEKNAGQSTLAALAGRGLENRSEKQFLSAPAEQVSAASSAAGITGAQKVDAMPQLANNPRRFTSSSMPEPVPVRSALVEFLPATAAVAATPAPAQAAPIAAPESMAHRAVETVMALVDSQRNQPAQGGLVNLSFKIGHDDLTVRVQLRDGVLQAQFRTDSPELRAALASEWRSAGPASTPAGSLRVAEPEFVPASASSSFAQNGFAHGQSGSHQQNQQQAQFSSSLLFPELRGLRRGAPVAAESAESRPAAAYAPHALHLTAVA